ncbi:hypothetical protein LZ32DRAFT_599679 [Colletotrichum eremochloae]|nr:hypothetical protein LZ32DRAFT_599679 [Colletotrichum eremochloae]
MQKNTYNTRYSLVITDPTTNPAFTGVYLDGAKRASFVMILFYLDIRRDESER